MQNIKELLKKKELKGDPRNKNEFQAYGNRLAEEFNDPAHRALYIRLAKIEDRNLIEQARAFVMGSEKATTKGKLFMWKLSQLKTLRKEKETALQTPDK